MPKRRYDSRDKQPAEADADAGHTRHCEEEKQDSILAEIGDPQPGNASTNSGNTHGKANDDCADRDAESDYGFPHE
jgi:hypothetical protein